MILRFGAENCAVLQRRGLTKKALNVDAIPVMVAAFLDRKIWRAESVGNYDKTSLGQLLKNFLHYYGTFDSAEEAVGAGVRFLLSLAYGRVH